MIIMSIFLSIWHFSLSYNLHHRQLNPTSLQQKFLNRFQTTTPYVHSYRNHNPNRKLVARVTSLFLGKEILDRLGFLLLRKKESKLNAQTKKNSQEYYSK